MGFCSLFMFRSYNILLEFFLRLSSFALKPKMEKVEHEMWKRYGGGGGGVAHKVSLRVLVWMLFFLSLFAVSFPQLTHAHTQMEINWRELEFDGHRSVETRLLTIFLMKNPWITIFVFSQWWWVGRAVWPFPWKPMCSRFGWFFLFSECRRLVFN